MTIAEAINAELAQSNCTEVGKFSKAFRTDELANIEEGEFFVIPEDYKIISRKMMRDGKPVTYNGETVTSEYIKVQTNKGRICNFYPSSLTKVAFRVDPETGKDATENRIVRTEGNIVSYVKDHPDMDATMQKLKGCTIWLKSTQSIAVRRFGVTNAQATKADVDSRASKVGHWELVGTKKPSDWPENLPVGAVPNA